MKTLLRGVFFHCESLRYSFEQSQPLFRRAYVDYSNCVSSSLSQSAISESDAGSAISTEMFLQTKREEIISMFTACADASNARVPEIDEMKNCQIEWLDDIISSGRASSSSSVNFNQQGAASQEYSNENKFVLYEVLLILLAVLVILLVGFILVQAMKSRRIDCIQSKQQQPVELPNCESRIEAKTYAQRFKSGFSSLNLERMQCIVKKLREENPTLSEIKTMKIIDEESEGNSKELTSIQIEEGDEQSSSSSEASQYLKTESSMDGSEQNSVQSTTFGEERLETDGNQQNDNSTEQSKFGLSDDISLHDLLHPSLQLLPSAKLPRWTVKKRGSLLTKNQLFSARDNNTKFIPSPVILSGRCASLQASQRSHMALSLQQLKSQEEDASDVTTSSLQFTSKQALAACRAALYAQTNS